MKALYSISGPGAIRPEKSPLTQTHDRVVPSSATPFTYSV